ncbi:hypothetical protein HMF3257_35760 [Spirosoma telluris]|uniref:Uncharacterized protein n=1 Tax=Spirosoma telluris TaxID=2183553 RepID=A0A327NZ22_9BACT|nr:hypothetical protein HMF3257_35760 [Spirosoma telluris]
MYRKFRTGQPWSGIPVLVRSTTYDIKTTTKSSFINRTSQVTDRGRINECDLSFGIEIYIQKNKTATLGPKIYEPVSSG